ncbi:MAG: glycosyltransferase [Flavobacteriaceae bacterium TMED238]|nr:MAG: glycosyltransferase [Flavobacteriaceae bacterium TMED238]|tara:strand:- start:278 stop:1363 length:1086 start_codon:yes stop_codon:yes gene_type:complete
MNNKLKILHVLPTLKKDGAEVQLVSVINEIKNINFDVFTFDMYREGDSVENSLENYTIYTHKFIGFITLYKLIKREKYDIVHSHLPKSDFFVGVVKILNNNFKHVVSVHAKYGTRTGENKFKYFFSNYLWRKILNQSSGVIAISESINKWLTEDIKVKKDNISTIHYGIRIKDRSNKIHNQNVIGMAARILPWKGWDKVLEVGLLLKQNGINFKIKLAGSDDIGYLKDLKKMITKYELEKNVEVLPHFSDIDKFFYEIDLFLFLSESEGFGLVALEAVENNVAVICSNISPLNEFVLDINGSLVDRNDTQNIAKLIKSYFNDGQKILKSVQIDQKKHIVKNFSISKSAESIKKFYINTNNN